MTERIIYITPRNSGFSGGKIGLDGNTIWILPEKFDLRFRQGLSRVNQVNAPLRFVGNREVAGILQISGKYQTEGGHVRNALATMSGVSPVAGVTLSLDNGVDYIGSLVVVSDQNNWSSDGTEVAISMAFQFTGTIAGDGWDGAFDDGSSGEIVTNLKDVTGSSPMSYTRGYSNQQEDRASEPFAVIGIRENSGVPISLVEQRVIAAMGGGSHFWRGDVTLPFSRISNIHWSGVGLITGDLIYDRNALDCRAYQYESDIGFVVKGSVGEIITGDSGSDADNVCTDLASGPFAIRTIHWRDRTVPYTIHLLPCVSSSNPKSNATLKAMVGTINSNSVTIDGIPIDATELRFDGAKSMKKIVGAGGTKYFFYLKFSELTGGWIDGTLTCARLVPLPLEGNQTLPSYTIEASTIQLYEYDRLTFSSIATLCPECYS